ncbi:MULTISPECIES: hypothetical protein [Desulfitobacterium]|uniref:Uncharacterized protein n=1 Tax=Desulfitobacterium dehalogenans (strain ATCC 51507 / DSM 9161 / JW/IU-DC1) TaxID=756499 RepID=I4A5P7_DESDJ|nr:MULTISPECIES: hypothetical protein [Desulfitobacterium]AFL99281.1 hypothetical protein Desde_0837 [Desulfitobacterium dehalogenans ATCC 51507]
MASRVSKRERNIWLSLLTVIIAISVFVIMKYQTTLTLLNQKVIDYEAEKKTWIQSEANLTSQVSDLKAQTEKYSRLISTFATNNPNIINTLKRQGFNGSVQDIVDDLLKHNELIPYDGVLGGKMGFYSKDNIYVLSDKWVYAYFDDGHINGYMLLNYSVNNEDISWKVIDSYLAE